MKLFGSYGSPFTRRVGGTLLMYGFKFEHVALRSSVPEELEELKQLNPLARVPALQTEEGMVFVDSTTILDYLDTTPDADAGTIAALHVAAMAPDSVFESAGDGVAAAPAA